MTVEKTEKQKLAEIKALTDEALPTACRIFGGIIFGVSVLAGIVLNLASLQADSKLNPMGIGAALSGCVIFVLTFGVARVIEQNSFLIKRLDK
jgi:hypothetical protein